MQQIYWDNALMSIIQEQKLEIEKDLEHNTISAKLHFRDENGKADFKNIRIADIKDLF